MFDRLNPYRATILSRYRLNTEASDRETWHVVLGIDGEKISYQPGDSVAIYPSNDPEHVVRILQATGLEAKSLVKDSKGISYFLADYLERKANIMHVTKKFLLAVLQHIPHSPIASLFSDDEKLKCYIASHTVVEVLEEEVCLEWDPQLLIQSLQPSLPRFYSIASSQSQTAHEMHLTIGKVCYSVDGRIRHGVCSRYLCDLAPLHDASVPLYVQKARDFTLPVDDQKPIIMIGPGTGVAPFRSFMLERIARQAVGKSWLFFGERSRVNDFFYEEFWQSLVTQKHLRLDVAFSRDQHQKIYVQDRIREHKKEFWSWLQDGAILYVCGSADKMAKDVDLCLHEIVATEGGFSFDIAKEYVKQLRHEKRYLRDIY